MCCVAWKVAWSTEGGAGDRFWARYCSALQLGCFLQLQSEAKPVQCIKDLNIYILFDYRVGPLLYIKKMANLATYETSLWLKFWWRFLRQDTEKHNIVNRLDCANPVFSQPTRTLLGEIDNSLQQNGKIMKYHKYEEGWRSIVRAALDSQQQTHQHGTKWAGKANIWPKMAKSAYYDFIFWYLGPKVNLCFVNRAYYRYNRASTFPFVPTPQENSVSEVQVVPVAHPEFWPFLGSGATEFWSEINETRITLQLPNLTPLAKKSAK